MVRSGLIEKSGSRGYQVIDRNPITDIAFSNLTLNSILNMISDSLMVIFKLCLPLTGNMDLKVPIVVVVNLRA